MAANRPRVLPSRTERTIVLARIVLAASALFAGWLDPVPLERYVIPAYTLHATYAVYAVILALVTWNRGASRRWPLVTHLVDIAVCVVFQSLSLGPSSSPFFIYFIFSLFCGALRWGWRGTLRTTVLVLTLFLVMGLSMRPSFGPDTFHLNRYVVRTFHLAVIAGLLLVLGQYEFRLRLEIERLASWPSTAGVDMRDGLGRVFAHAAEIIGARRALVAWDVGDEPWLNLASWSATALTITRHGPHEFDPRVPPELTDAIILCTESPAESSIAFVGSAGTYTERQGPAFHTDLLKYLGVGVVSAPFTSERVSGRVFFSDLTAPTTELMALTGVVAREIGTSLEQLSVTAQLREIAASEQRLLVAHDLHDGVLQSLTGIRFELQNLAADLGSDSGGAQRDRLLAVERSLAIEQRELRMFINGLKPHTEIAAENTLLRNLDSLRERVALEWKVPLTIRVGPHVAAIPDAIERAVPPMVHEAVANALKHSNPSRIWVDVDVDHDTLRIIVGDDGHGFPFRGRYDHAALAKTRLGPISLRDRTTSLGGQLTIESEGSGSRVEIALPLVAAGAA